MPVIEKKLLEEGQNLKNIYEVECFLGEGAFAEVYRVKHRLFGRQALKIFKVSGSIEEINTSLDEAVLLSKLGHRGIIRVFDAGVYENENGTHGYFTMEHIAGGSLHRYWESYGNKFLPVDESVEIVRQVAEGLALAHQDSPPIVHRDIKPHNILIGYDVLGLRACLSDFGLAKHVHPLQLAASVRGTLIYKAPETFTDSLADSCAGDVWALGVVLYQLLTNSFPYELEIQEQLASRCFNKPLKPANHFNILVNEALEKIVARALEIDKTKRYQNATELLADLREWRSAPSDADGEINSLTKPNDSGENRNRQISQLIKHAYALAHHDAELSLACEALAEALELAPELRARYEPQLKLWQSGKIM